VHFCKQTETWIHVIWYTCVTYYTLGFWVLTWLRDLTTFKIVSQYLPSLYELLRYPYANNSYTIYFHPNQYNFKLFHILTTFNIYIFIIFINLKYFYVRLVSKMWSHSTWYTLTVLHISECWSEDDLKRMKHVATININIYKLSLCFQGNFNPFQCNFSANRVLLSSYLFWVVKRLVDYL
jgi:hypothetical protein